MIRDEATQAQVDAAAPGHSTWLAANAGSGKTRVLTDRVARLLLDDVLPEHILCLTYTKAAATEMQNRLFRRLGAWAMLEADALRQELRQLGVEARMDDAFLQNARTLFARAIETPGGLRIQTIHSFCSSLLRRFPLEARVSPQFKEMEDRAAEMLRAEVLDQMAEGRHADLVRAIAPFVSGDDVESLLADLCKHREALVPGPTEDALANAYGLLPGTSAQDVLADVFLGSEADLCEALVPVLRQGGKTDVALAASLVQVSDHDATGFAMLKAALLTQAGTLRKTLGTKGARGAAPDLFDALDQLAARVEAAVQKERAVNAFERDKVLHAFARTFLPAYELAKQAKGWLDFDDLITRARDLLSDEHVAAWVLYRLDGGIDHILVDEAQDTSPVQWQVIERLAQEFTSGEGARADVRRTIFVVGDKKQSIYSFQGADPSEFDRMRDEFRARLERTDAPLSAMELEYSFRSAEPILRLVDNTFEYAGASGFTPDQKHRAFKDAMPGRVDLWPVVEKVPEPEEGKWFEPVDRVSSEHHTVTLARRIAHFVKSTIDAKTPLPVEVENTGTYEARPVHAGDFLILVRGRSRLFSEIIRACKQANLPIAGADRLKVMAELAVRDIVALLSFLATSEDDLSLATALRSPLFGWSEQQLFTLAHHRKVGKDSNKGEYLWEALYKAREDYADTYAVLKDLRDQTDYLRPYDLIDRILTRHNGRRLLIGRLGQEAEDGVNALLQQALAYEQTDIPSLTGFLEWAQSDDLQIKRAPDSAGQTLRVMTVHGAKGLEAPIVILPDSAAPRSQIRDTLLTDDIGLMWKSPSADMPQRQVQALDAAKAADMQERDRLLYVALTRAEKWLVVAAAGDLGKSGEAWYEKVARGMVASGAEDQTYDFGELGIGDGKRIGDADWSSLTLRSAPPAEKQDQTLPDHLMTPAPDPAAVPETRSPSDLGGAKALPGDQGDEEDAAKARGNALHLMLEQLAPLRGEDRALAAQGMLQDFVQQPDMTAIAPLLPTLLDEALRVLDAPDLAWMFEQGTLAEVPVTADLPGIGRIHGVIDRLIISPDRVTIVDYKSNRAVPDSPQRTPSGLLRQMGAYSAALGQLYPDRPVHTALLWTATTHYMPLPHDVVTQALADATTP